eukprot:scaffold167664_cov19-Tisochrysis_lutea.AAC.1
MAMIVQAAAHAKGKMERVVVIFMEGDCFSSSNLQLSLHVRSQQHQIWMRHSPSCIVTCPCSSQAEQLRIPP